MKTYTRRRGRCRRQQHQTRSKKYLKTRKQRSRYGGVSKRPSATPGLVIRQSSISTAPPPSINTSAKSVGELVFKNGLHVSQSRGQTPSRASLLPPKTSLRNAGISKKEIKDDAQALEAAIIIANFPQDMNKFLQMVINNYELLKYEGVKLALREKISINMVPAVGRLSTNGIIFISYICGKINHLLTELSRTAESDVVKKRSLRYRIKQIENVICLLDGVGCSWGFRPYNETEMNTIVNYYREVKKDEAGLQEYFQKLNELIDTYFPVLKQPRNQNPSHVVSSSMCRRLIPGHVMCRLPNINV